jgi:hypothetical protein
MLMGHLNGVADMKSEPLASAALLRAGRSHKVPRVESMIADRILKRNVQGGLRVMVGRLTKPCSRIAMTSCGVENLLAAIC